MELTGTEFRAESPRFIGTKITVLESKHGTGLTSGVFRGFGLKTPLSGPHAPIYQFEDSTRDYPWAEDDRIRIE